MEMTKKKNRNTKRRKQNPMSKSPVRAPKKRRKRAPTRMTTSSIPTIDLVTAFSTSYTFVLQSYESREY